MKRFIEREDRNQATLLPEYLDDYIAENNPVRAVDAFVRATIEPRTSRSCTSAPENSLESASPAIAGPGRVGDTVTLPVTPDSAALTSAETYPSRLLAIATSAKIRWVTDKLIVGR